MLVGACMQLNALVDYLSMSCRSAWRSFIDSQYSNFLLPKIAHGPNSDSEDLPALLLEAARPASPAHHAVMSASINTGRHPWTVRYMFQLKTLRQSGIELPVPAIATLVLMVVPQLAA